MLPKAFQRGNVTDFTGCEFQSLLDSYGIETKPDTVKIDNSIVEIIHLTMILMMRTANLIGLHFQE